ncbi:MAG: hypothetical protein DRH20_15920 [Deltaproteobacteria bacterium]|nr:MAG: hypothetical protein DRH20_15920 [Deltaproteobacteria bacterium]
MNRRPSWNQPMDPEKRSTGQIRPVSDTGELFRLLYDHLPVMIHSANRQGILVHVNERWLSELGYSREEVRGRPLSNFLTESSAED